MSSFRLDATVPESWQVVTQGNAGSVSAENGKTHSEWINRESSEALSLVANRFVATSRDWKGPDGTSIRLSTYLFPDNAQLADEYLDATQKYLEAYIPLLGPYPFETFGVVENFFASGLGMPSFTLLGSGVIKRHYIQPYALGHEIVHSWIGNAVFNRVDQGNWVEGLTTYLANYYWHELSGDQAQARDQRRLMLRGYNLHVPPARDYPVGQFTHKRDERDNAIGYQKAAMIFHLLRQEIGEEPFWRSLKSLVVQYRGRHADWHHVARVFRETAGKNLRWFFAQWIEESGAPELTLRNVAAHAVPGIADLPFQLTGTTVQSGRLFQSPLPLRVTMDDGREQLVRTQVKTGQDSFAFKLPAKPTAVELDPDTIVIRRVSRQALPPVLNHYVTDQKRSVISAFSDASEPSHPFHDLIKRIAAQENQKPAEDRKSTRLK